MTKEDQIEGLLDTYVQLVIDYTKITALGSDVYIEMAIEMFQAKYELMTAISDLISNQK